jgi:HEAT repeat protein
MRRRQVAITLVTAIVLGMSGALYLGRLSEPSSHGYTLSQLLATYDRIYHGYLTTPGWQDTRQYVGEIGTNVLPVLLRWMGEECPAWKTNALSIHQKLPSIVQTKIVQKWLSGERERFHAKAAEYGFQILGPVAAPAIPELERMIGDTNRPVRAERALNTLPVIGAGAVPALLRIVTTPNASGQLRALQLLARMGTNAAAAVPTLVELAKSKDVETADQAIKALDGLRLSPEIVVPMLTEYVDHPSLHYLAISTLTDYGVDAKPAVPRLVQCLTNIDHDIAITAARALSRLKLESQIAIPALMNSSKTSDDTFRKAIAAALHAYLWPNESSNELRRDELNELEMQWYGWQFNSGKQTNIQPVMTIPFLVNALTNSEPTIRQQAAIALGRYGTQARPAIPSLLLRLQDPAPEVTAAAMQTLGELRIEPEIVVPRLTQCLKVPELRASAVLALVQFGAEARPALSELRKLLEGDDDDIARLALRAIDSNTTDEPRHKSASLRERPRF